MLEVVRLEDDSVIAGGSAGQIEIADRLDVCRHIGSLSVEYKRAGAYEFRLYAGGTPVARKRMELLFPDEGGVT